MRNEIINGNMDVWSDQFFTHSLRRPPTIITLRQLVHRIGVIFGPGAHLKQ